MNEIVTSTSALPIPRAAVTIREATIDDVPFIDSLQKIHSKQVGFMPTKQLEGKIKAGHVLVAEESGQWSVASGQHNAQNSDDCSSLLATDHRPLTTPVGYCIGTDRYFKHDDVGIIYHLNVAPGKQRGFIGAALLGAMFDRAAYGCKLFCCWCAQDIEANRFWESMGFVPLAFRAGSEKKSRVHIFWQKRIRAGDNETPWWFPAKTDAGAMREDRLVLPIPPGKHWSDEMPRILPTETAKPAIEDQRAAGKARRAKSSPSTSGPVKHGPRQYGPPPTIQAVAERVTEKPKPQKKPKRKADPMHVAAARELRDRWLERVNSDPTDFPVAPAKYQVCKTSTSSVEATLESPQTTPTPLLEAA